jgi:hypothetical protein
MKKTVKTSKDDDGFLNSLIVDKEDQEIEDNLIIMLKKLGIKFNKDHNFHIQMLASLKDGTMNIEDVKKAFETRYADEIKKRKRGCSI